MRHRGWEFWLPSRKMDSDYTLKNDWERIINHDGNIDLIVFKAKRGTGNTGRIALKLDKSKMTVRDRIEATKTDSVTPLRKRIKIRIRRTI